MSTGDSRVDDALRGLDGLEDVPPAAQVDRYTEIHQRLQDILADAGRPESAQAEPRTAAEEDGFELANPADAAAADPGDSASGGTRPGDTDG